MDGLAAADRRDQLEDLRLIGYGGKRAGDDTQTAGHALILVDDGTVQAVAVDSIGAAGFRAGPSETEDGMIRAGLNTAAAFDAFILVNQGILFADRYSFDRTDRGAGMRKTLAAIVADLDPVGWTGFAGKRDDIDERQLQAFPLNGAFTHAVR